VWRASEQALYWTDIPARRLWRYQPDQDRSRYWQLPEMAGCIAMHDEGWLAAMQSGLYALPAATDPAGVDNHAEPLDSLNATLLAAVAHAAPDMRFNDGRCDRQGRFWAGTMVQDMTRRHAVGRVYRYTNGELAAPLS